MHAYIYIGEKSAVEKATTDYVEENKYKAVDVRYFEIKKVEDVKALIRETNFSFSSKTIYVINNFDEASIVAQNAFLKRLEEPQENLTFLLNATKEAKILDTIISRCIVQHISTQDAVIETETLWGLDINSQFALIDKIKTREEGKVLLENMLHSKNRDVKKVMFVIQMLERIEKNANTSLQLAALVTMINV